MLYENARPSTSEKEQEDCDYRNEHTCTIPMIVFSESNPAEDAEAPTQTSNDECDKYCDSFESLDVLKFAWQIAKGMVRKSQIYVTYRIFLEALATNKSILSSLIT